MSSCLRGGGRAYGFELDVIKPNPSSPLSSSLSGLSSPSSTLSESSNSPPRTITIKKTRAPRKRPNETYNEAAALLSAIYPNIFPTESPKRPSTKASPFCSFTEYPELLPPFPVLVDSPFLIRDSLPDKLSFSIEIKPASPVNKSCTSPTSNELKEPSSPSPLDDDFDTESILDEEVEEGIDSIMGNLSMSTTTNEDTDEEMKNTYTSHINPYLRSLLGLQLGSKFELGIGFRYARNSHHTALRQRDNGDWWRFPAVPIHEIVPKLKPSPAESTKKKKKKVEKKEEVAVQGHQRNAAATATAITTNTTITAVSLKEKLKATGLGLKLNHEDIIEAWSGRGSMFAEDLDSPNSSAEVLAKLADIDLSEDCNGISGIREASVLRYKEKRRTRLFSKKIRYQVRKVNADKRPRTKGRFVRSPSLLQQAIDEES